VTVAAFAPAKVNLYLHVTGRRADGYHLLDSLVAFADIGDRVTASSAAALSLEVSGPEAAGVAALGGDNLVMRAARLLAGHAGIRPAGAVLRLVKNLPVASGIGGGSSDAAAAIRALCALWGLASDELPMAALAAELGADLPVCLYARAAWVEGIGERIEPAPDLPEAGIVLVNPGQPLPTAAVFSAASGRFAPTAGRFAPMPRTAAGLAWALSDRRNDLTEAAIGLVPAIASVLAALEQLPGALLARMSGSGATCFALFADRMSAERACAALAATEPGWWSAATAISR
jgi:4-diphosphocytidyl-2-C-methyl-D-erythritol kinase